MGAGETSLTQRFYIDSTVGDDTKLVFSYTVDINVNVTTPNNNNYTVIKDEDLQLITISIEGEVVSGCDSLTVLNPNALLHQGRKKIIIMIAIA